jgi:hypothetical protein
MSCEFFQLDGVNQLTFPISRERLATIKTECDNHCYNRLRENYLKLSIDLMSKSIIKEAYRGKKFAQLHLTYQMALNYNVGSILPRQVSAESQLPEILNKLKERFPDCEITMDPMKTYIYVSW